MGPCAVAHVPHGPRRVLYHQRQRKNHRQPKSTRPQHCAHIAPRRQRSPQLGRHLQKRSRRRCHGHHRQMERYRHRHLSKTTTPSPRIVHSRGGIDILTNKKSLL